MNKFIKAGVFLKHLFDEERPAAKAAVIIEAILAACSPRLSEIAQHRPGHEAANYKMIQRSGGKMSRPQARKTSYVRARSFRQAVGTA